MPKLSTLGRRYDRHVPPALPLRRMLRRDTPNLPPVVDLRAWDGPIKDQGDEGACTAHAGTSAFEWVDRKYFNNSRVYSPQYTYAKELIRQGSFPQDVGSDGLTLCQSLIVDGVCEASLFPYVAGQIVTPTAAQDAAAAFHVMGAFHGITDYQTCLSVLGDATPWPVMVGFTVYSSFEDAWAINGVMPTPRAGEEILGGHEVKLSGYDVGDAPTLRPAGCPPAVLVQNSWGVGWALSGYFWMPLAVLSATDTDMKIAHTGHPWAVNN